MSRLSASPQPKLSPEAQTVYDTVTASNSGLPSTFQTLYANPPVGSGLANLQREPGLVGCHGTSGA